MKKIIYLSSLYYLFYSCSCENNQSKIVAKDPITVSETLKKAKMFFQPINVSIAENPENPVTEEKVLLGRVLYHDTNLSKKKNISCNSCHDLNAFGVDGEDLSDGDAGKKGLRNSSTVFNSALQFSQFWDGRAKDVEQQSGMPILDKLEHNIPDREFLETRLRKISNYKDLFAKAFPNEIEPITYSNLEKAIGAFERTLIAKSRFDDYLNGNENSLTKEEKKGLEEFISIGCIACHTGPLLGGGMFQKFPLFGESKDYLKIASDLGKARDSKKDEDKNIWKVPQLRNVTKTAPYMHNGEIKDLHQMIRIMAKAELDKDISSEQIESIIMFFNALEGDITAEQKKVPTDILALLK